MDMPRWCRKLYNKATRITARILLFLSGFYYIRRHYISIEQLRTLRAHYTNSFDPNDQSFQDVESQFLDSGVKPFFIVSNHISNFDSGVIACDESPFAAVAKASLQQVPVVSSWAKKYQDLFYSGHEGVDIKAEIQRRTDDYYRYCRQMQQPGDDSHPPRLLIFSEGTLSNGRALLRFHKGAFFTGTPVQPIVLRYPYWKFNPSICNHVNWKGDCGKKFKK